MDVELPLPYKFFLFFFFLAFNIVRHKCRHKLGTRTLRPSKNYFLVFLRKMNTHTIWALSTENMTNKRHIYTKRIRLYPFFSWATKLSPLILFLQYLGYCQRCYLIFFPQFLFILVPPDSPFIISHALTHNAGLTHAHYKLLEPEGFL